LVLELTFIPAVRVLLRAPRSAEAQREREHPRLDRALDALSAAVLAHPARVLALGVGAAAAIGAGAARIEVNTAFRSWFDADEPAIVADRAIRERFTGTSTIRVLVEADGSASLADPAALRGIDALEAVPRAEPHVTPPVSGAHPPPAIHPPLPPPPAPAPPP